MNPIIYEMFMAFVRQGATALGIWLVAQGWISEGDQEKVVAGLIMAMVSLASVLWTVYRKRVKFLTAAAMTEPASEKQIEAVLKDPAIGKPPATKPKDAMPYLTDPSGSTARHMGR